MNIHILRQVRYNAIFLFEMEDVLYFKNDDIIHGLFSSDIHLYNIKK